MSCHSCSHQTAISKLWVWLMIHSHSLNSPGDAESASLVAQAAVKAEPENLSTTDSGLGGSIAVSYTTAGATQFSKVRLINDC